MYPNPYGDYYEHGGQQPGEEMVPESEKILKGLLSELPVKANALVNKIEKEIEKLNERTESEIAQVREQAERQSADLENKAENKRKALLGHAIEQLEPMQNELFRTGELGKALAIFVQVQMLKNRTENVQPDPGNLMQHEQVGKTYYFRVLGNLRGAVWGSDVYTSDSHLGTAAVHAGVLEDGEEGVVRVTMVDMSGMRIMGSLSNGVMSMDWGRYHVGYRVIHAAKDDI